jgi:scyllo-inositol 2-dehydrogenase (NADP+)
MNFILIIGLGIQGKKRKKILDQLKIKSISLDPYVSNSDYKLLKLIPKDHLKKITHVMMCTPYGDRLKFITFFLDLNVKILIEKPLIYNDMEKKFFIKNKNKIKNKIYSAYNHRFEASILKCREILKEKKIGNLYFCKMTYGNGTAKNIKDSKWKNKGKGVIMDLMPHLLDTSFFLFNKIPKNQNNSFKKRFENTSPDYFNTNSINKSFIISLDVSYLYWKNYFKILIIGSKGMLELTGLPKWGETKLLFGKRKLPSGKPKIQTYKYPTKDMTWKREIKYFINGQFKEIELVKEIEIYNFIKKC